MEYLKALETLEKLEKTGGKNDKISILQEQYDNTYLKQMLIYTYNPFKRYGVKKWGEVHTLDTKENVGHFVEFIRILDKLESRELTGNAALRSIEMMLDNVSELELKWFSKILKKDLKAGFTSGTINKVWEDLVPVFEVQLAHAFEKHVHKIADREFHLTEKLDGVRCIIFNDSDGLKAFKRSGKEYDGLPEVFAEMVNLPKGVYDGEILSVEASNMKDRETLQSTMKKVGSKGEQFDLIFNIFDYLTLEDWENPKDTYITRRLALDNLKESEHIKIVRPLYFGTDINVIPELLSEYEALGKEGLMLNISNCTYEKKRTYNVLKIKTMQSYDGRILGFNKGKKGTKYENSLGSLIVSYKDGNTVNVPSMDSEIRQDMWDNQEKYMHKIVEVQYFRESKNAKGGKSVSFPVFKMMREDKNEVNYDS